MKTIFLILTLMLTLSATISAQSYTRSGNTYISSTGKRTRVNNVIETTFKVKESDGKEYVIYCSKSTGACFIKKISRNGNEYRKYLGEEVSKEICKEINVEYKPRKHD